MDVRQSSSKESDVRIVGETDARENEPPQSTTQARALGRRRVTQAAPDGSDPHPFDPPEVPRSESENDDRLRADVPPHWD